MESIWIEQHKRESVLQRHEAFWEGELEDYALTWVTVPNARPGDGPEEPPNEEELWTDVEYIMAAADDQLSRTYYAGDALPVFNPWLGPDQVAAWLGCELTLKPSLFTSWVKPFVEDWSDYPELKIDPQNRWWRLYLEVVRASVERGRHKWVTTYPDLHTGIDGLSAIRGQERLLVDMLENPAAVRGAMGEMTRLFEFIVDAVSDIVLPAGQGTTNWTMGWSAGKFLCIGQNDLTCMISPDMFDEFCLRDTRETVALADCAIYHLDGPDAIRHLPKLLEIEALDCIQWIQGAGNPPPSHWLDMLRRVQAGGKSVQIFYGPDHGDDADLDAEIQLLCHELDPKKLFFWAILQSTEQADHLVELVKLNCRGRM